MVSKNLLRCTVHNIEYKDPNILENGHIILQSAKSVLFCGTLLLFLMIKCCQMNCPYNESQLIQK